MSDVSLLAIAGAATANFPATVFIGSGGQAGNIEREYIYKSCFIISHKCVAIVQLLSSSGHTDTRYKSTDIVNCAAIDRALLTDRQTCTFISSTHHSLDVCRIWWNARRNMRCSHNVNIPSDEILIYSHSIRNGIEWNVIEIGRH